MIPKASLAHYAYQNVGGSQARGEAESWGRGEQERMWQDSQLWDKVGMLYSSRGERTERNCITTG